MPEIVVTPAEAQEIEATEEYVTASLAGQPIRVKTVDNWRPSYLRALRQGDYDTWAAGALHPEDVDAFIEADATFAEINTFTAEAMESAGEPVGKPSARSARSRSTRKR
jgi:hypothetical protein